MKNIKNEEIKDGYKVTTYEDGAIVKILLSEDIFFEDNTSYKSLIELVNEQQKIIDAMLGVDVE